MFNSLRIYAQVLSVLTHEGVLGECSTGNDKGELTGEYDLLEVLVTLGENLLRSLMILTYEEVFEHMWSTREDFLFLHGSLGNLCWLYPQGVSSNPWGLSSSQLTRGLPLCLEPAGESLHDIVCYWGIFLKIWTHEGVLLVPYGPLRDALDAINLLWLLVWSSCLLPN